MHLRTSTHATNMIIKPLLLLVIIFYISFPFYCRAWLAVPPLQTRHLTKPQVWGARSSFDKEDASLESSSPTPPIPFRDETSFVLAGELLPPADNDNNGDGTPIRQSATSTNPLLSPPRQVPNPYGWMRDDTRTNETVLNHLHAENVYGERITSHLADLREKLYQEFLYSIHETDYTTPSLKPSAGNGVGYWYYVRFQEGESYPRYCRAPQSNVNEIYPPPINEDWENGVVLPGEHVYLDGPAMAQNKSYFALGKIAISPNQQYVAYSLDEKGDETCQLCVKHIETGKVWILYENASNASSILECDGSIVWDDKGSALFYIKMNDARRPFQLYRRQIFDSNGEWINNKIQKEELLLEEKDEVFNLICSKSFDGKFLVVQCSSKETSEMHYLDLEDPTTKHKLECIAKRKHGVRYRVTHCRGYWLVQTNIGGLPNVCLKACRVGDKEGMTAWKDVVSSDTGLPIFDGGYQRSLDGITIFNPAVATVDTRPFSYAVITGREEGMPRVWICEVNEEIVDEHDNASPLKLRMNRLEFDEDAYDSGIGANRDASLPYVVISYDSLVTPPSHIAIPLSNPLDLNARQVLKEKEVLGYEKEQYSCERTTVRSRDGKTDIPVSLVYHQDVLKEISNEPIPVHLFGYGSYGASIEASFRSTRLPLLERGFVYALAHVRGGGELGRPWHDEAKYLTKKNTFNDFVDIARWLVGEDTVTNSLSIGQGITSPQKLSCEGRSAGGLLIGACLNQQPDLFQAAILGVPFVDVTCTMIDSTVPLTVPEWEEWGCPNEEGYFEYIYSYSPIDNIQRNAVYPACLITGGLHDPRVQYWEPAKYAAELRHQVSNRSGPILIKMDIDSGHFSGADRYKSLRDLAFDYAFLLDSLGCA